MFGLFWGCAAPDPRTLRDMSPPHGIDVPHDTELGERLRVLINEVRQAHGAAVLANDTMLQRIASRHSADMVQRGFFDHQNPDGNGPLERLLALDPTFEGRVAENLFALLPPQGREAVDMAPEIVSGWMNSPRHRHALIDGDYARTGIGFAFKGREIYVTQIFVTSQAPLRRDGSASWQ